MEHIKRSHPFGVTFGEVVIDSDHMYSLASQCIKEYRKGCYEGFSLSCRHLGNLALVEDDTADELDIIMDHVPCDFIASGHPVVLPEGIVSVNRDKILGCTEGAVEVCRAYLYHLILLETASGGFHDCKSLRKNLLKDFFYDFVNFFDKFVRLGCKRLLPVERNVGLKFCLDFCNSGFVLSNAFPDHCLEAVTFCAEFVV